MSEPYSNSRIDHKLRDKLIRRRYALEYTQAFLSEKIGVSIVTISKIELGRHVVTVQMLIKLCKGLETTPNEMLAWEGRKVQEEI